MYAALLGVLRSSAAVLPTHSFYSVEAARDDDRKSQDAPVEKHSGCGTPSRAESLRSI
jgi:hypothetical protein